MALALMILVAALAALAKVSSRLEWRRAADDGDEDEGVLLTCPEWAVELFGTQDAFELADAELRVIEDERAQLADQLSAHGEFLAKVPVSALWTQQGGDGVDEIRVFFAEGSVMRLGGLEPRTRFAALGLAYAAADEVRLDSIDVDGPHARLVVAVAGRRCELLVREVELDVPRRNAAQRRAALRTVRRAARRRGRRGPGGGAQAQVRRTLFRRPGY